MKGNFDCTQFISIISCKTNPKEMLETAFEKQEFVLVEKEKLSPIKHEFLKAISLENVFELRNDNFMGEFEDWIELDKPPYKIGKFIESLKTIVEHNAVKELIVILVKFVDLEDNSALNIRTITAKEISELLFTLSNYYYGYRHDYIIMKIIRQDSFLNC